MRYQTKLLEGREHYVCPVVLIREGVLNGSGGPLFYPRDEIAKSERLWNGKPIVVLHPDINFNEGSAGAPEVFDQQKVGSVFNVRFDGHRLLGEAWIDVEKAEQVDKRLIGAILANKPIEVSTGLYTEAEPIQGVHNGREYHAIATEHRPDHLAILLDSEGACSIADGCGMLRLNNANESEPLHLLTY